MRRGSNTIEKYAIKTIEANTSRMQRMGSFKKNKEKEVKEGALNFIFPPKPLKFNEINDFYVCFCSSTYLNVTLAKFNGNFHILAIKRIQQDKTFCKAYDDDKIDYVIDNLELVFNYQGINRNVLSKIEIKLSDLFPKKSFSQREKRLFLQSWKFTHEKSNFLSKMLQNSLKIDQQKITFQIDEELLKKRKLFTKSDSIKLNVALQTNYSKLFYNQSGSFHIRIQLISDEKALFSIYDPINNIKDYFQVENREEMEKIMCNMRNLKRIKIFFSIKKQLVGRTLHFSLFNNNDFHKNLSLHQHQVVIKKKLFLQNFEFLKSFFDSESFFEIRKLKGLGRCYIKIVVFNQKNRSDAMKLIKFISLEFSPFGKRRKIFKFCFSQLDFSKIPWHDVKDRYFIGAINKQIIDLLILNRNYSVSRIVLPIDEKNNIVQRMSNKGGEQFLNEEIICYKIIVQIIKKIGKDYAVLTVKKNLFLEIWGFKLYFARTNRTFVGFLRKNELKRIHKGLAVLSMGDKNNEEVKVLFMNIYKIKIFQS